MTAEFRRGSDFENVPGSVLTQELLSWGVEQERVVELPDFTLLKPYDRYSSQRDRVTVLSLPLSPQETLLIEPSNTSGNTHRLSIIGIPEDAVGKVYLLGLPYKDTTEVDRLIADIDNEESDSYSARSSEQLIEDLEDPSPPLIPFWRRFGSDVDEVLREREENNRLWEDYDKRRAARDKMRYRQDDMESARYQRMRDRVRESQEPIIRHNVSFFRGERDEEGKGVASIDFEAQVDSGSIFLPYQPLDWAQFNHRLLLKLFLEFVEKDKVNFEKWDTLFKSQLDQLALTPRLAISARLQVLGAEVK